MPFKTSGERIHNMTEVETPPIFVPERYVSKYKTMVQLELKTSRESNKTMGRAQETLPQPAQFLKKHSRKIASASCKGDTRCLLTERKPTIPKPVEFVLDNDEERGRSMSRNFMKENKRRVIKSAPPRCNPKFVDSHKGSIQTVDNSGLKPKFIFKKNFGSVPRWLQKYEKERKIQPEVENKAEELEFKMYLKLSSEEKEKILKGLKVSLEEKNKDFLLLPVIIDTPYLINYKRKLEKIIKQLEKDIQSLESHSIIYVSNN